MVGRHRRRSLTRRGALSRNGDGFSRALGNYIHGEGTEFMQRRCLAVDLHTGTSVNGMASEAAPWEGAEGARGGGGGGSGSAADDDDQDEDGGLPFPCHLMCSTMPRAIQTATWENLPYPIDVLSNLNPLDKGDFTGYELEEIAEIAPEWYAKLERDPFRTRFPGGECYQDLINRLEPAIIDMEQQVGLVVVVSHVSVIQMLMSYFRATPVQKSAEIAVPIHTCIKFTPARGGGWAESHVKLLDDDDDNSEMLAASPRADAAASAHEKSPLPIWGDHFKPLSRATSLPRDWTGPRGELEEIVGLPVVPDISRNT